MLSILDILSEIRVVSVNIKGNVRKPSKDSKFESAKEVTNKWCYFLDKLFVNPRIEAECARQNFEKCEFRCLLFLSRFQYLG